MFPQGLSDRKNDALSASSKIGARKLPSRNQPEVSSQEFMRRQIMKRVGMVIKRQLPELVTEYRETPWLQLEGEIPSTKQIIFQAGLRQKIYQVILLHFDELFLELEEMLNAEAIQLFFSSSEERKPTSKEEFLLYLTFHFFERAWLSNSGFDATLEEHGIKSRKFFSAPMYSLERQNLGKYRVWVYQTTITQTYPPAVSMIIRDESDQLIYAAHRVWDRQSSSDGGARKKTRHTARWLTYVPRGWLPSDLLRLPEFSVFLETYGIPYYDREENRQKMGREIVQFRTTKNDEGSVRVVDNTSGQLGISAFSLAYEVLKEMYPQMRPLERIVRAYGYIPLWLQNKEVPLVKFYVSTLRRIADRQELTFAESALEVLLAYQREENLSSIQEAWHGLQEFLTPDDLESAIRIKNKLSSQLNPKKANVYLYNFMKFATGRKINDLDKALDLWDVLSRCYQWDLEALRSDLRTEPFLISYEKMRKWLTTPEGEVLPVFTPQSAQALIGLATHKDVRFLNTGFRLWERLRVVYQTPLQLRRDLPDAGSMKRYRYLPLIRGLWEARIEGNIHHTDFGALLKLVESLPQGTFYLEKENQGLALSL